MKLDTRPTAAEAATIHEAIEVRGLLPVAEALCIDRQTAIRLAAGFGVRRASLALVRQNMHALAGEKAGTAA